MNKGVVYSFLPLEDTNEKNSTRLAEDEVIYKLPLVRRLRLGLPMREFHELAKLMELKEEELARYLGISVTTLHRRKKTGTLSTTESERIIRVARLLGMAVEVLESKNAAREWLLAENPGLDGESPMSYADTEIGAREVENLLGRLDYGIF